MLKKHASCGKEIRLLLNEERITQSSLYLKLFFLITNDFLVEIQEYNNICILEKD